MHAGVGPIPATAEPGSTSREGVTDRIHHRLDVRRRVRNHTRISAVAVCCSSVSVRSRLRASNSFRCPLLPQALDRRLAACRSTEHRLTDQLCALYVRGRGAPG